MTKQTNEKFLHGTFNFRNMEFVEKNVIILI